AGGITGAALRLRAGLDVAVVGHVVRAGVAEGIDAVRFGANAAVGARIRLDAAIVDHGHVIEIAGGIHPAGAGGTAIGERGSADETVAPVVALDIVAGGAHADRRGIATGHDRRGLGGDPGAVVDADDVVVGIEPAHVAALADDMGIGVVVDDSERFHAEGR